MAPPISGARSFGQTLVTPSLQNFCTMSHHVNSLTTEQRVKLKETIILNRQISGKHTCWIWTRALNKGYGISRIWPGGPTCSLHQISYCLFRNRLRDDLEISHLCNMKACFNPSHLAMETHIYNRSRQMCFSGIQTCWHIPMCLV